MSWITQNNNTFCPDRPIPRSRSRSFVRRVPPLRVVVAALHMLGAISLIRGDTSTPCVFPRHGDTRRSAGLKPNVSWVWCSIYIYIYIYIHNKTRRHASRASLTICISWLVGRSPFCVLTSREAQNKCVLRVACWNYITLGGPRFVV